MKKKLYKLLAGILIVGQLCTLFGMVRTDAAQKKESLKELYHNEFDIGVAVPEYALEQSDCKAVIKNHFNIMTMENETKPSYVMDEYTSKSNLEACREKIALNFSSYKKGFEFAKENNMKIRGHVLVWHSQTPDWIFYEDYDTNGTLAGRELMLKRMENYIKDVIDYTETNYPGIIYAWDVVNEAVKDEFWGVAGMRTEDSLWYQTIGEDYVQKAFEYARKYTKQYAPDHTIKLFYNDYNEYFDAKRAGIIALLEPVKKAGNLDGVGMQSHLNADMDVSMYTKTIKEFYDELGVEIQVTELDVGCVRKETGEEYATAKQQGAFYQAIMEGILAQKKAGVPITAVTFWGLKDDMSWRSDEGGCLLFDAKFNRKPAYEGVAGIMRGEKTALTKEVEEAKAVLIKLQEKDRTALQEKIDLAYALLQNPNAVQTEIDTILNELTTEIANAEKVIASYKKEDGKEDTSPAPEKTPVFDKEAEIASYIGKTFEKNKLIYVITACNASEKAVTVSGIKNKTKLKSVKIPDKIVYDGMTFLITEVGTNAFKNQDKLTKAVVGKNIETIGQKAFYGCKSLKMVQLKAVRLRAIGKNAFAKGNPSIQLIAPKGKANAYSKLVKKSKLKKFKIK